MLERRIANRYAGALFDLARTAGTLADWEEQLAVLAQVMEATPELMTLLTHPEISRTRKRELVSRAFGGKIAREILAVLMLLIRRSHEPDIAVLLAAYRERWNAERQLVPVTVTSAVPLTAEQTGALTAVLSRRFNGTVQLQQSLDPSILAGLVISIGDRMIDASARSTLEHLRDAMRGGMPHKE